MHAAYRERADFLTIYIKEAHPEDEWQMGVNEKEGVCYAQPTTLAERCAIAGEFIADSSYSIPLAVDDMRNSADEAYAGWPERLYVIDPGGTIAYKGGVGPFGFDPDEVEAWLRVTLD